MNAVKNALKNVGVRCGVAVLILAVLGPYPVAYAGIASAAKGLAKELCETVVAKLGRSQAQALLPKVEAVVSKYGDEAVIALRKCGPEAADIVQAAGSQGAQCIKLMARRGEKALWVVSRPNRLAIFIKHGDDAATAMLKHGEIVEKLISRYGDDAASALARVDVRNARHLAMMTNTGVFESVPGQSSRLFSVIKNGGDEAAEFVWKNKGALAVGATLITFLDDPETFISGAAELGSETIEHIAAPIAQEAAAQFPWWCVWTLVLLGAGLIIVRLLSQVTPRRRTVIASTLNEPVIQRIPSQT